MVKGEGGGGGEVGEGRRRRVVVGMWVVRRKGKRRVGGGEEGGGGGEVSLLFGDGRPVWTLSIPGTWPSQPLEAVCSIMPVPRCAGGDVIALVVVIVPRTQPALR